VPDQTSPEPPRKTTTLLVLLALGVGVAGIWGAVSASEGGAGAAAAVWLAGAAGLGLVTGYTTGASNRDGTVADYLTFLSGGVLVPLLGAAAGLTQSTETMSETYTYYDDTMQVATKVTETVHQTAHGYLYPVVVIGGFLAAYSALAIGGLLIGAYHRGNGFVIKLGAEAIEGSPSSAP